MNSMRPAYRDLPGGNAGGVFGKGDVFGCLNFLTTERVLAASKLIRTGQVFSLNATIGEWPDPNPMYKDVRPNAKHVVLKFGEVLRDDYLDGFYLQCSTQWDHFLHVGDMKCNHFYNHMQEGAPGAGMGAWAERGIVGRGVLLDLARWRQDIGKPFHWRSDEAITADDLEACARSHGVKISEGTILVLRLGWETGYRSLPQGERDRMYEDIKTPGLEPSEAVAGRLWDWGVAAVAADNPALERWPVQGEPILHELVLARLGMPFGEFWLVDALAEQCAKEKRYEFFVTSAPLNVRAGVGSPANVLAIL